MASIHPYQTKTGQRRYSVRYRDADGKQRSRAFESHKDAHAFKLDSERKRLATRGRLSSDKAGGRRLFAEAEVRQWLRSRHEAER